MLDLDGPTLSQQDKEIIEHPAVGGIIFFSRNYQQPEQLLRLTQDIRKINPKLLIAVDQEGGRVQRFREHFSVLAPLADLGKQYEKDQESAKQTVLEHAQLMAHELRQYDIDFSFTPVLDLNKGMNSVIGDRAFHSEPNIVIELAKIYCQGLHQVKMPAVGKHFPGHGSVVDDSHVSLPIDSRSFEEVEQHDLKPFASLIEFGIDAIMPAHIQYEAIDKLPPCFSSFWLQNILRERLKFHGAIFSDDLSMQGAALIGDYQDRAFASLEAGCDMILICNNRQAVCEVIDSLPLNRGDSPKRLKTMRPQT